MYIHISIYSLQPLQQTAAALTNLTTFTAHCHGMGDIWGFMGISQGIELAGWVLHNMYLLYVVIVPCVQDIFNTFSAQHLQR
jgi:hypothetical protein